MRDDLTNACCPEHLDLAGVDVLAPDLGFADEGGRQPSACDNAGEETQSQLAVAVMGQARCGGRETGNCGYPSVQQKVEAGRQPISRPPVSGRR